MDPRQASQSKWLSVFTRRWVRAIFALVLLAGAGYTGIHLIVGPRLRPVAIRQLPSNSFLFFSASDHGYPAIQATDSSDLGLSDHAGWLTDECQPLPVKFRLRDAPPPICPDRKTAIVYKLSNLSKSEPRLKRIIARRDGGVETGLLPPDAISLSPWLLTSTDQVQCEDPRYYLYYTYRRTHRSDLVLYDSRENRIHLSFGPSTYQNGIVFHRGTRFLLMLRTGQAQIFNGRQRIGRFGTANTRWNWGEDGTAWTVQGNRVQMLVWLSGHCRLTSLPIRFTYDNNLSYLGEYLTSYLFSIPYIRGSFLPYLSASSQYYNGSPANAIALWNNGRFAGCTDTINLWPRQVKRMITSQSRRFAGMQRIPHTGRRLTLYRDGRRLGTFVIRLDPKSPLKMIDPSRTGHFYPKTVLTSEHLAFTGDGRYLSWVVETAKGKTIYVFRVPQ